MSKVETLKKLAEKHSSIVRCGVMTLSAIVCIYSGNKLLLRYVSERNSGFREKIRSDWMELTKFEPLMSEIIQNPEFRENLPTEIKFLPHDSITKKAFYRDYLQKSVPVLL
jgi:hypothetical protein